MIILKGFALFYKVCFFPQNLQFTKYSNGSSGKTQLAVEQENCIRQFLWNVYSYTAANDYFIID